MKNRRVIIGFVVACTVCTAPGFAQFGGSGDFQQQQQMQQSFIIQQQMQQQQLHASLEAQEAARKKNNEVVDKMFGKATKLTGSELVGEWSLQSFEGDETLSKALIRFGKNGKMTVTGKKNRTWKFDEESAVLTEIVPGVWWGETKITYRCEWDGKHLIWNDGAGWKHVLVQVQTK